MIICDYLSTTRVVPLYRVFNSSSLHSQRFAENNKCAVSGEYSCFLDRNSCIIPPIVVCLSAIHISSFEVMFTFENEKSIFRLNRIATNC